MNIDEVIDWARSKDFVDKVLIAKEVGSRSYGTHTEESDYDINIVYTQELPDYMKINEYEQNIHQTTLGEDWEIQGWNLKRFCELIYESNPTTIGFLQSDVCHYVYNQAVESSFDDLLHYVVDNADPKAMYYTYRSMLRKNYNKYLKKDYTLNENVIHNSKHSEVLKSDEKPVDITDKSVILGDVNIDIETAIENNYIESTTTERTVKRNLFVARAIMCCKWVQERGTIPPVNILELLDEQTFLTENQVSKIQNLIDMKMNNNNEYVGNLFEDVAEEVIDSNLDTGVIDDHRSIEKERVNEFIDDILDYS